MCQPCGRATSQAVDGAPSPPTRCQTYAHDEGPNRPPRGWWVAPWVGLAAGGRDVARDRGSSASGAWCPAVLRLRHQARDRGAARPWSSVRYAAPWAAPIAVSVRRTSEACRWHSGNESGGRAGPNARHHPTGEDRVASACRSDECAVRLSRSADNSRSARWYGRSSSPPCRAVLRPSSRTLVQNTPERVRSILNSHPTIS